jgi:hypothetical protein
MKADEIFSRPVRVMTPKGQRTFISKSELLKSGLQVEFSIKILGNKLGVTVETIKSILEYGEFSGIGQFRNGGFGRFKVISFEEVVV